MTEAIIEQFKTALKSIEIDYEVSEEGDALHVIGETSAGVCDGFLFVETVHLEDPDEETTSVVVFCELAFVLPGKEIPDPVRGDFFEMLVRVNEALRIGAFEFHIEASELRYRVYFSFGHDESLERTRLIAPFIDGISAIDDNWPGIAAVLDGACPAHASAALFLQRSMDEELPEELYVRVAQLLKHSLAVYQLQQDANRIHEVQGLIAQLTLKAAQAVTGVFEPKLMN